MRQPKSVRGFTLIEVVVTVGVFVILLSMAIAVSTSAISRMGLRSAANSFVQTMRRAQTLSQNYYEQKQWGVYLCNEAKQPNPICPSGSDMTIIMFGRNEYAQYDSTNDDVIEINKNITLSGSLIGDITKAPPGPGGKGFVFERFTGDLVEPTFTGALIFNLGGESARVRVTTKGVTEFR